MRFVGSFGPSDLLYDDVREYLEEHFGSAASEPEDRDSDDSGYPAGPYRVSFSISCGRASSKVDMTADSADEVIAAVAEAIVSVSSPSAVDKPGFDTFADLSGRDMEF